MRVRWVKFILVKWLPKIGENGEKTDPHEQGTLEEKREFASKFLKGGKCKAENAYLLENDIGEIHSRRGAKSFSSNPSPIKGKYESRYKARRIQVQPREWGKWVNPYMRPCMEWESEGIGPIRYSLRHSWHDLWVLSPILRTIRSIPESFSSDTYDPLILSIDESAPWEGTLLMSPPKPLMTLSPNPSLHYS